MKDYLCSTWEDGSACLKVRMVFTRTRLRAIELVTSSIEAPSLSELLSLHCSRDDQLFGSFLKTE